MKVFVKGYYQTKFGELWKKSLNDLIEEATFGLLKEAGMSVRDIDGVFVGNMLAGLLDNNLLLEGKVAEILRINTIGKTVPILRVEAACASGGLAFWEAVNFLKAGKGENVLVLGVEKMTDFSTEVVTEALASALPGQEQLAGLTFPGAYALFANYYFQKYGYDPKKGEEALAHISVKNHYHGFLNEKAQFRKKITVEQVLKSPYIAYPLKVLDSSPISDGAAAIILSTERGEVEVAACETAVDNLSLSKRQEFDSIRASYLAGNQAFKTAGVGRKEVDVVELHDCFSIAEVLAMEDLGFWEKGKGLERAKFEEGRLGKRGSPKVNLSGGLKATGHPVGATGIKQIGEIFLQLTGRAGKRQLENPKLGLAHNVAGSGALAVVTILKR